MNKLRISFNYGKVQPSAKCEKYVFDSNLRASDNVILFLDHKIIHKSVTNPTLESQVASTTTTEISDDDFEIDDTVPMEIDSDSGESEDEMEEYYRFQFIQYDRSDPNNWPSLTSFRRNFLDELIESLQSYFDDDVIHDFDALSVKSLAINDGQIVFPENYQQRHETLALRFQINSPNIGLQRQDLLHNIATTVTAATFKEWLSLPDQIFYSKLLETAETDDVIEISDELFDYLAAALTVPVGSADAEQLFNIIPLS